MSLLDQINADRMAAMKEKDPAKKDEAKATRTILSTLKGAIEQVNAKGATDDQVKAAIKAALKGVCDMKAILVKAGRDDSAQEFEINVLSKYMPQQFDEMRTREVVQDAVAIVGFAGMQDMGKIMGHLAKYGEQLDKGLANKILRERL